MGRPAKYKHPLIDIYQTLGISREEFAVSLGVTLDEINQVTSIPGRELPKHALDRAFWLYGVKPISLKSSKRRPEPVFPERGSLWLAIKAWQTGPVYFMAIHFRDPRGMAKRLRQRQDTVSRALWELFSNDDKAALQLPQQEDVRLKSILEKTLNGVLGTHFYRRAHVSAAQLSPQTRELLKAGEEGDPEILLNRCLIQDAFPDELIERRPHREGWSELSIPYFTTKFEILKEAAKLQGRMTEFVLLLDASLEKAQKQLHLSEKLEEAQAKVLKDSMTYRIATQDSAEKRVVWMQPISGRSNCSEIVKTADGYAQIAACYSLVAHDAPDKTKAVRMVPASQRVFRWTDGPVLQVLSGENQLEIGITTEISRYRLLGRFGNRWEAVKRCIALIRSRLLRDGGIRTAGDQHLVSINPYWANLAALALILAGEHPNDLAAVADWLAWYAKHQSPDGTFDALKGKTNDGSTKFKIKGVQRDPADVCAATFLLAVQSYRDRVNELPTEVAQAASGALQAVKACTYEGLTWNDPKSGDRAQLLMNNVEVHAGLFAAQRLFTELGDPQSAVMAKKMRSNLVAGISRFWDAKRQLFLHQHRPNGSYLEQSTPAPQSLANLYGLAWVSSSDLNPWKYLLDHQEWADGGMNSPAAEVEYWYMASLKVGTPEQITQWLKRTLEAAQGFSAETPLGRLAVTALALLKGTEWLPQVKKR